MKSSVAAAGLCALTLAGNASALPAIGAAGPAGTVVDAEGRGLDLHGIKGKPTLLVYEDKEATKQNLQLKSELSKLAAGDTYRQAIALVAVADVEGYDYWPARGFVKSAIRTESKKLGNTIYVDWTGGVRKAAGFKKGLSTILLMGRDGKVLFSHEGAMAAVDRTRLLSLLQEQVAAKPEAPANRP